MLKTVLVFATHTSALIRLGCSDNNKFHLKNKKSRTDFYPSCLIIVILTVIIRNLPSSMYLLFELQGSLQAQVSRQTA